MSGDDETPPLAPSGCSSFAASPPGVVTYGLLASALWLASLGAHHPMGAMERLLPSLYAGFLLVPTLLVVGGKALYAKKIGVRFRQTRVTAARWLMAPAMGVVVAAVGGTELVLWARGDLKDREDRQETAIAVIEATEDGTDLPGDPLGYRVDEDCWESDEFSARVRYPVGPSVALPRIAQEWRALAEDRGWDLEATIDGEDLVRWELRGDGVIWVATEDWLRGPDEGTTVYFWTPC